MKKEQTLLLERQNFRIQQTYSAKDDQKLFKHNMKDQKKSSINALRKEKKKNQTNKKPERKLRDMEGSKKNLKNI